MREHDSYKLFHIDLDDANVRENTWEPEDENSSNTSTNERYKLNLVLTYKDSDVQDKPF